MVHELGMTGLCEHPACWGIPQMNVTGFASFGEHGGQNVSGPRAWRMEAFEGQDSFYHASVRTAFTRARPSAAIATTFRRRSIPRGNFTYNGFLTGQAFGDYLLGYPRNTLTSIDIFSPHFRYTTVMPYVQDDWRITPTLTLNLGLRWEWAGRPVSEDNSISSVVYQGTTAKLVTARNPEGLPRSLAHDDFNNFAPRVGFAWSPKMLGGKTVFRAAYGIFYQRELINTWIDLAINDPFIRQTNFNLDTTPASPYYWAKYNLAAPAALAPSLPLLVFLGGLELARWHDPPVELQRAAIVRVQHGVAGRLRRQPRAAIAAGDPSQPARSRSGAGGNAAAVQQFRLGQRPGFLGRFAL